MKHEYSPQVRRAKVFCYFVLAVTAVLIVASFKIPAVWAFGNSSAGWLVTCVVAIVVGLVALRAMARR